MTAHPAEYTPLYPAAQIADRIAELGRRITLDYAGRPLTLLVVLKGSVIFAADLCRAIDVPLRMEFIGLRSYGAGTTSSGAVEITLDVKHPLEGQHVLVVEDIVDTGITLDYLLKNLATRNPASVRLAALLHKPSRTVKPVTIDYVGFEIPDLFVVGYGLDFAEHYRNLPGIGHLVPPPV